MQPLLDLNKLHKKQRRQKVWHIIIGSLVILALIAGGSIALGGKKPIKHVATVIEAGSVASGSSSSTPVGSSSSTPTSNLSQEIAADKALVAKDEAEANADLNSIQQTPDETAPAASSFVAVSLPAPATVVTAPSCSVPSNLNSLYNSYTQAEGALNSFNNDPSAYVDTYGLNEAALQAAEQQQRTSLEATASQAQNAYQMAERSVSC